MKFMGSLKRIKSYEIINENFDKSSIHEVVIALQQLNLDLLERMLHERSLPGSELYQQWLTFDEIGQYVENKEASRLIHEWLNAHNDVKVTWISPRGEYIKVESSIATWERILHAKFFQWRNTRLRDSIIHVYATSYSIPLHLSGHIMAIFNTIQIPPQMHPKYYRSNKSNPSTSFKSKLRLDSLSVSGSAVTVSFLNSLYKISTNEGNSSQSQSVFETSGQNYSPNDLEIFQDEFNLEIQPAKTYNGHNVSYCGQTCFEGNLDIQYIMGVAQYTTSIYWYVPASNNQFLVWILDVASESSPPLVNSISWGSLESDNDPSILTQFNVEAMKLGLQGVTVTVSTGDNGVSFQDTSSVCMCDEDSSSDQLSWATENSWTGVGYFPSFPATSPYVTAVGATMGPNKGSSEVTCQSNKGGIITSGGGFSTYFNQSSWQVKAVSDYLKSDDNYANPGYNPLGRGYPDVSLIGVEYAVIVDGEVNYIYGTSCSSPVFAAFISILNAARSQQGYPSLGFLNPTLYSGGYNQSVTFFNDIVVGENNCCANDDYPSTPSQCCNSGFNATKGEQ